MPDNRSRIKGVQGTVSNLLQILIEAKWMCNAFNPWHDTDGCQWSMADWTVSQDIVTVAIAKSYFKRDLVGASLHYNVLGM